MPSLSDSSYSRSIAGLAYVAVFSLATFVKYKPREISVTIPQDSSSSRQR